jgi:glycine/D-amino acid oxidase-like deaminating enzyme
LIDEADAVVIGAGALGSSVAYHLARLGRRVALVERHGLASQTSPRAAGLTGQIRASDLMTELAMMSVRAIERFEDETGEPLVFHQSGALKIARTPRDEEQLHREVERAKRVGLDLDLISADEARRLAPFVEATGIRAVTYSPSDLYLEPAQLPLGYARAASKLGATLLTETAATGILTRDGAVERVITDRGEIRTPVVVDAAGAWSRMVADMLGAGVPVVPTRHQLLITQPIDGVGDEQPIVRVIDTNVYVRPDKGGLMLGGYEPEPVQYDDGRLSPDFQIADLELDISVLRRLAHSVIEQFPVFREWEIREHRGGLPTMTPDGEHVVGPVPTVDGFFVATGCCVGGLSISPAVGQVLSEWIVNGEPPMDLTPLAPARFQGGPADDRVRAECLWQYAHHYSDVTPSQVQERFDG